MHLRLDANQVLMSSIKLIDACSCWKRLRSEFPTPPPHWTNRLPRWSHPGTEGTWHWHLNREQTLAENRHWNTHNLIGCSYYPFSYLLLSTNQDACICAFESHRLELQSKSNWPSQGDLSTKFQTNLFFCLHDDLTNNTWVQNICQYFTGKPKKWCKKKKTPEGVMSSGSVFIRGLILSKNWTSQEETRAQRIREHSPQARRLF